MSNPVLVTGATGGVGTSLCRHLSGTMNVLAVGRDEHLLDELCRSVDGVSPWLADLVSMESVDRLLDGVLEAYGYIPYVINNAGVMISGNVREMGFDELQASMQVNALAPFRIMQRLLPQMVANDFGRIVNITSGAPLNCFAGYSAYSGSKGALNAFTVTAANEHAQQNIKINLMSPGPVRSKTAPAAPMDPSVCHATLDYLLHIGSDGPTGGFFWLGREIPLFPDLEGIEWLKGTAPDRFPRILS
jgi:NAD(P)-dependent dehydrogenase (short-subunit alcohol dehydrogenase family)